MSTGAKIKKESLIGVNYTLLKIMPHQIRKGKGPLAGHSKTKKIIKSVHKVPVAVGNKVREKLKVVVGKGKKWVKGDNNPVQKVLNKKAGIANQKTAGGRIQKQLVKAGFSESDLRRKMEATQASKQKRSDMQKLRKSNPEKYKKLKREQRKQENLAKFKSKSSTWD